MNIQITNKSERMKNMEVVDVTIAYSVVSEDNELRSNGRFTISKDDYDKKSNEDLLKLAKNHYKERK